MEVEATLTGARRAAVHEAVTAMCATTGVAQPALPDVQGVCLRGPAAASVTGYPDLAYRVGADTARYALVRTRANRPVRLDLAQCARRDEGNALWRVRYLRARALLCLRTAAASGAHPEPADHDVVTYRGLAEALDAMPSVLQRAARVGEPHRIADHLERRVAVEFTPVASMLTSTASTMQDATARAERRAYRFGLALVARCAQAVAIALPLLGVAAPDRL